MTLETYPFLFTFNKNQYINTTSIRERLNRKPHNLFAPHRTDFFMIYLFTEGTGDHMVDFDLYKVKSRSLLFISQGQIHSFDPMESYDGRALIFTESFFCRSQKDRTYFSNSMLFNNYRQPYFDVGDDYEELYRVFLEIYNELRKETDAFQGEILHNLLYRIFLIAERHLVKYMEPADAGSRKIKLVNEFKELVEQYYQTHKWVKFYAQRLAVSQKTLQSATTQVLGKSPKEWISQRILLESKRILAYDTLSVKELSAMMHFDDATNFVKFFKKNEGISPSDFRKRF